MAQDLKKFGITAIMEQIGYTAVPHHFAVRIDFLGPREDNEIVVIEGSTHSVIPCATLLGQSQGHEGSNGSAREIETLIS